MSAPATVPEKHHPQNEWAVEKHVYEPHMVGLPPVRPYLAETWKRREFAIEMSNTKIKAQQYNTIFGILWLILAPMMLAGVYFILIDIIRRGHRPPDFIVHLLAAIFIYYYIGDAIRDGAKSVVKGGKLILNSSFPRLLLPISSVLLAFRKFIPTSIIFVPIWLISDRPVTIEVLWVIPLIGFATMIAFGLATLVSTVQVYFRDLAQFLPYALRLMLYTAPVLYFAPTMPARYEWVLDLNPVGQLLAAFDQVLFFGLPPTIHQMVAIVAWATVTSVGATLLFLSREREFAVRI